MSPKCCVATPKAGARATPVHPLASLVVRGGSERCYIGAAVLPTPASSHGRNPARLWLSRRTSPSAPRTAAAGRGYIECRRLAPSGDDHVARKRLAMRAAVLSWAWSPRRHPGEFDVLSVTAASLLEEEAGGGVRASSRSRRTTAQGCDHIDRVDSSAGRFARGYHAVGAHDLEDHPARIARARSTGT
jgi:hypothetical protein